MSKKITWKTAIKKVLMEASSPLHYSEITNIILKKNINLLLEQPQKKQSTLLLNECSKIKKQIYQ